MDCKKQIIILMIPNEEKEGWHYSAVKTFSVIAWNNLIFIYRIVFILLEQKVNLNLMKK